MHWCVSVRAGLLSGCETTHVEEWQQHESRAVMKPWYFWYRGEKITSSNPSGSSDMWTHFTTKNTFQFCLLCLMTTWVVLQNQRIALFDRCSDKSDELSIDSASKRTSPFPLSRVDAGPCVMWTLSVLKEQDFLAKLAQKIFILYLCWNMHLL